MQTVITPVATLTQNPVNQSFSLTVLVGIIFIVTVVRASIQPWLGSWFHWAIPLRARRDQSENAIRKILTLPLEFYDENNPGRVAGRLAKGLANHTWTYPEIAGQLIPKLARVCGIFVVIWFIEWRIALLFLISFVFILGFSLQNLRELIIEESRLDHHQENTESRTSEIITNIKTVMMLSVPFCRILTYRLNPVKRSH